MHVTFDGLSPFMDSGIWSPAQPLGVAVSGGGDSMALLHLIAQAYPGTPLLVATVDHGLRAEAAQEAAFVAAYCCDHGHSHSTLQIEGLQAGPNLQARARAARYEALQTWATAQGLRTVAIGHTQDDLAETFLLRLARGSGLEGLAAMAPHWQAGQVTFIRPLLGYSRHALRQVLTYANVGWCDDPSNEDTAFERVKLRNLMPALQEAGITPQRIAGAATHLRRAKEAVEVQVLDLYNAAVTHDCGSVVINMDRLRRAPEEISHRLVARLAAWVGDQPYAPRYDQMVEALHSTNKRTLHGVVWSQEDGALRLARELNAAPMAHGADWDGRWHFEGWQQGDHTRALGEEGLRQCPNWRNAGVPRHVMLAAPSLWRGEHLLAAPFAGFPENSTKRDKLRLKLPQWTGHCPLKFPR